MILHLSDEQWNLISPLLTKPPRLDMRGRPRRSDREIFEAALNLVKSWGSWRNVSRDLAPYQTVFRRVREWEGRKVLWRAVELLAKDMEEKGGIPLRSCFFDDLFKEVKGKDPSRCYVQLDYSDVYYLDDPPPTPWPENMKEFFQEPRVWRYLRRFPSEWVRQRLPDDLPERLRFV